uniref:Putative secreted protein n=1 Tax=Anopheles marajoara TaxID=58244 RepID=A0A2M4CCS5_9DIPT
MLAVSAIKAVLAFLAAAHHSNLFCAILKHKISRLLFNQSQSARHENHCRLQQKAAKVDAVRNRQQRSVDGGGRRG